MTTTPRARRRIVLAAIFALLSAPLVLALAEAVSFNVANRNNGSIVSSGEAREYLVYVPRSHDRSKATPLVISMHGAAMWPAAQMQVSQWNRVADRHGFIVVYPSGTGLARHKAWRAGDDSSLRDVGFIADLINTLSADFNIDAERIRAAQLDADVDQLDHRPAPGQPSRAWRSAAAAANRDAASWARSRAAAAQAAAVRPRASSSAASSASASSTRIDRG